MTRKIMNFMMVCCSLLLSLSVSISAVAHGPSRLKIVETIDIAAPAEKVWQQVGAFDKLHNWLPPVTNVEMLAGKPDTKGAVRLVYVGDATLEEKLKKLDSNKMSLKYKISKNNIDLLPVTNYQSTITVKKIDDSHSKVIWKAGFYRGYPNNEPPEELNDAAAIKAVTGLYQVGLKNLKSMMEK